MQYIEMVLSHINFLAVFVAALANIFIGALWYSPILFSKPWMKEVYGTTDIKEIKQNTNMGFTMGMAFFMTFITAFGLSILVYLPDESIMFKQRLIWGLGITGVVAVLVVAANTYKHYQFEQRSFKLAVINGSHDFVSFMVMALIMTCWR